MSKTPMEKFTSPSYLRKHKRKRQTAKIPIPSHTNNRGIKGAGGNVLLKEIKVEAEDGAYRPRP